MNVEGIAVGERVIGIRVGGEVGNVLGVSVGVSVGTSDGTSVNCPFTLSKAKKNRKNITIQFILILIPV